MDGAAALPLAGAVVPSAVRLPALRLMTGRGTRGSRVVVAATCTAGVLLLSAWGPNGWANTAPGTVRLSGPPVQTSTSSSFSPRIT
ncbi:hypothetical protein OHT61_15255 [Streptomyces sp. NBC_00178]|uniref:hypothetical protein n=1 Tax=Streptomyces sp. NBC_00178 TaxID=2975672 RepID=UPI002E28FE9F|nr:hypothetical protein [Streptomyces sp. NBC_00178]